MCKITLVKCYNVEANCFAKFFMVAISSQCTNKWLCNSIFTVLYSCGASDIISVSTYAFSLYFASFTDKFIVDGVVSVANGVEVGRANCSDCLSMSLNWPSYAHDVIPLL